MLSYFSFSSCIYVSASTCAYPAAPILFLSLSPLFSFCSSTFFPPSNPPFYFDPPLKAESGSLPSTFPSSFLPQLFLHTSVCYRFVVPGSLRMIRTKKQAHGRKRKRRRITRRENLEAFLFSYSLFHLPIFLSFTLSLLSFIRIYHWLKEKTS